MLRAMKTRDPFSARYTIQRLGLIESAELTIRPLTLFFGPNGTNKTWAAYGLYGLLQGLSGELGTGSIEDTNVPLDAFEALAAKIDDTLLHRPSGRLSVSLPWIQLGLSDPFEIRMGASRLARLLALEEANVADAELALCFAAETARHLRGILPSCLDIDEDEDGYTVTSMPVDLVDWWPNVPLDDIRETLSTLLMSMLPSVRAFPAERKALLTLFRPLAALLQTNALHPVTGPRSQLHQRLIHNRLTAAAQDIDQMLPEPAQDFFLFLDALANGQYARLDYPSPLATLGKRLATDVVGGRLDFDNDSAQVSRRLRLRFGELDLPPQGGHSLLRSLGALDLYLRHVAQPGDVILIDEPEMNAHPTTQLAIAEFIAMMVNAGLRVIATTHSPYIVDHLHNLIEGSRLTPEQQAHFAPQFKLGTPEAFISPDRVATYHFGHDGTVTDAFDRSERVVDWSTFGDEAEYVANLYASLLEAQPDD